MHRREAIFDLKRMLVVGGDRRALCLAERLAAAGYMVETLGLKSDDEKDVHIKQAEAVLFPYPFSVKNGLIPSLTQAQIRAEKVLKEIHPNAVIIAERGMDEYLPQGWKRFKRYSDAEDFERRNAELAAEAALCESMLHSSLALMDANVLVTGYGLFGRAIARKCKALGANVWIAARREEQRAQAITDGMKSVSIVEMADVLPGMNLILNTIPARIFAEYHFRQIPVDCGLMELASAPYGFDMEAARAAGVSCVHLPGLPARYSPQSAALILFDAVIELIGEGKG